jgi:hypothetical protein
MGVMIAVLLTMFYALPYQEAVMNSAANLERPL